MKASETQIGGNHYKGFAIQPTEFIVKNNIPFLEGNVIKYVCRHRHKNGRQDIEKAIHCLQMLLEYEYTPAEKNNISTTKDVSQDTLQSWMAQNGYTL